MAHERIEINPEVMVGKPVIKGTRITVELILRELGAGMTPEAVMAELRVPAGLEVRWTGDAVIGRDFMASVQTSLDRAALATVVLLMAVLLLVYRSFWLALIPLLTIGIASTIAMVTVSRSLLVPVRRHQRPRVPQALSPCLPSLVR